jgi:3-hydroxyacyl-CoA dehydrogenase
MTHIRKVVVLGTGVLGSQIAFQTAYSGFEVSAYDIIGLNTPYNILSHGDVHAQKLAAWLKKDYIDKGKLGVASGEGFYSYTSGN